MGSMKLKSVLAAAIAVGGCLVAAEPASATTGGDIYNHWDNQGVSKSLYVYNAAYATDASPYILVSPGYFDPYNYNVTAFKLPYGCVGKSQYSGNAWPYKGTIIYRYSQNNLYLDITMSCS